MQRGLYRGFRLPAYGCSFSPADSVALCPRLLKSRQEASAQPPAEGSLSEGRNHRVDLAGCTRPLLLTCPNYGHSTPFVLHTCAWDRHAGRAMHNVSAAKVSAVPLSSELRAGLQRLGIRKLAEVQRLCLLRVLRGSSLAVAASPGAGKTLAYLLPVLQRLLTEGGLHEADAPKMALHSPFALVLVPSRELARQVMTVATALLPQAPILLMDSTAPLRQHQEMLKHIPTKLLIATPDRILALMRQRAPEAMASATATRGTAENSRLGLEKLRVLIVDEADALLRRDYYNKVRAIYRAAVGGKKNKGEAPATGVEKMQQTRDSLQLLFFSAVLPQELRTTIEADFPVTEILDMVNAVDRLPPKGMVEDRLYAEKPGERMEGKTHSQGSSSFGVGVGQHICYLAPQAVIGTSGISSGSSLGDGPERVAPPLQRSSTGRIIQTNEEAQLEKERKMLALAEILRTHIPIVQRGTRQASAGSPGTAESQRSQASAVTREPCPSSAASAPPGGTVDEVNEKNTTATNAPQCIVFADSHNEVLYVSNHPLLDGWRVVSAYSSMDVTERQHAMQSFAEGRASVLVCTDVAARGIDIPAVVLVVHMHPPSPPVNYIHRTGRAGRGNTPGTSVLLCSSTEFPKLRSVEQEANVHFDRRALPAVADCQELVLKQLTADILNVPKSQYAPLLGLAGHLHTRVGLRALATVLLKLGGTTAYSTPNGLSADCHSTLSGRRGFVPLLLYDPTHERLEGSMAARRFLMGLLPSGANAENIGRVAKSANGFVADVSVTYADHVLHEAMCREKGSEESMSRRDIDASGNSAANRTWVPVFHLERLPRLLNQGLGRRRQGRRLPWTKMRLSFLRTKQQARQGAATKRSVLDSDLAQLQALKKASIHTSGSG